MRVLRFRLFVALCAAALNALAISSCGGGGGGGGDTAVSSSSGTDTSGSSGNSGQQGSGGATAPTAPAFSGFDFPLSAGTFWEFKWDSHEESWAQGSSSSISDETGRFWVVLGPAATIQGVNAHEVKIYGDTRGKFGPRWKRLSLAAGKFGGSVDGAAVQTIFDSATGRWAGGGYFVAWPNNSLIVASNGNISSRNTIITGSAIVTGRSSSQSQCEYFPGVGNICGDSSYNLDEKEYFRSGVGPIGYAYYRSFSSCGGGFCSGGTYRYNVGLSASSLTGQSIPLVSEVEPNDTPATANALPASAPIVGAAAKSALANQGNTVITVTVRDDSGVTRVISPTVEDWYSFTLTSSRTVTISLAFESSQTSDLDLFILNSTGTALACSTCYSVRDNPTRRDARERITATLPAGTYRIGVDALLSPDGPVNYTLQFL